MRTVPHVWIPMSDGCRLAARLWLPEDGRQVPAILEYIPYRKNDATASRDAQIHPYFAARGYACVRVDLRGSGDSEGILLDEYLPQELDDAVEVIAWIAEQEWCDGSVGMMGKSWGGFNALQVAARRPPQLGAVISVCSTDDRYETDVHYIGGCVLASYMLSWSSTMLAFNARPPDPAVVGERWREMWMERLERTPPFIEQWLSHQRRDGFWKHGSVCEDFDAIACPVFMVGGWADAYTDGVLRFLAGYSGPRLGLIGPWSHNYPFDAVPGPSIGFLQESLRWWDRWLRDEETGIMQEPMLRVWMQDAVAPRPFYAERPGRWVGESEWPSPQIRPSRLFLRSDASLGPAESDDGELAVDSNEECGAGAGNWMGYGGRCDEAPDQRREDALALCFDSEPLADDLEILGNPAVMLELCADRPMALVAVRLCEVDGHSSSLLVTRGILNLTHRGGHETPEPIDPGAFAAVRIEMKAVAHRFRAGHRLRVALSAAYWPWAWPPPEPVTLRLRCGSRSALELPLRAPQASDAQLRQFEPAEWAESGEIAPLEVPRGRNELRIDAASRRLELVNDFDFFGARRFPDGLEYRESAQDRFEVVPGDPLSARAESRWEIEIGRDRWNTRVRTLSTMSATPDQFLVTNELDAFEGDRRVFSNTRSRRIPRDNA